MSLCSLPRSLACRAVQNNLYGRSLTQVWLDSKTNTDFVTRRRVYSLIGGRRLLGVGTARRETQIGCDVALSLLVIVVLQRPYTVRWRWTQKLRKQVVVPSRWGDESAVARRDFCGRAVLETRQIHGGIFAFPGRCWLYSRHRRWCAKAGMEQRGLDSVVLV